MLYRGSEAGRIEVHQCPRALVTAKSSRAMRLFWAYTQGRYPTFGGEDDQTHTYLVAMGMIGRFLEEAKRKRD